MTHDITLEDERVRLSPLSLDNYENLSAIAGQEKLVQYSPSNIEGPTALKQYVETALEQYKNKTSIPFLVFDKQAKIYAGSTRYMNIDWRNKVLHIGSTWIGREFHGTGLNSHMKYLMMNYALNDMGFEKVEYRIDERNLQSRKAVEKLGGVLEGILRENIYLLDGYKRNTCCYGILKKEWEETKKLRFQNFS